MPVLGSWLELRVRRNPGAAFGMGSATTIVVTLVAIAVAAVIVRVSRRPAARPGRSPSACCWAARSAI